MPKILIACEFSGRVREAFKAKGWDAWSCDLEPTDTPGQHIQGDVLPLLTDQWDMLIAHPPCIYLSYAATAHWNKPGRAELREDALEFFMKFINAPIPKICVENPVGYPNVVYRKPDQIIHPYYFGEPIQKRTCLWLKGLPKLEYSHSIIEKPGPVYTNKNGKNLNWTEAMPKGINRQKERSRTFQSVASAMANQWS